MNCSNSIDLKTKQIKKSRKWNIKNWFTFLLPQREREREEKKLKKDPREETVGMIIWLVDLNGSWLDLGKIRAGFTRGWGQADTRCSNPYNWPKWSVNICVQNQAACNSLRVLCRQLWFHIYMGSLSSYFLLILLKKISNFRTWKMKKLEIFFTRAVIESWLSIRLIYI